MAILAIIGAAVCFEVKLHAYVCFRTYLWRVGVKAGIPEEVVGRLLNHASKTITGQRYVKPKLDFLRSAMEMVVTELQQRLGKSDKHGAIDASQGPFLGLEQTSTADQRDFRL